MSTMTVEQALSHPEPLIAAWDSPSTADERELRFFADDGGSRFVLVGATHVPKQNCPMVDEELRRRHVRIAEFSRSCRYVWCADGDRFWIWSVDGRVVADGDRSELRFSDGQVVRKSDVQKVFEFIGDEYVRRGVMLALVDGSERIVAEEESEFARSAIDYNWNDVLADAVWIFRLGKALAEWLSVPLERAW